MSGAESCSNICLELLAKLTVGQLQAGCQKTASRLVHSHPAAFNEKLLSQLHEMKAIRYSLYRALKAPRLHKITSTGCAYFLASCGWSGVGVGVSRSRLGALAALGGRAAAAAAEADSLCSMG